MPNIFTQFIALLPKQSLNVGTVTAITATGAAVQLPGGAVVFARGQASVGQRVFVRAGLIEGEAPALVFVDAQV
jgi:hypothetical protein